MSYERVKDLPAEFKRYCEVWPETFRRRVEAVSSHLGRRRYVSGRPTTFPVADQDLIPPEYLWVAGLMRVNTRTREHRSMTAGPSEADFTLAISNITHSTNGTMNKSSLS